ncbi:hypothetical protein [Streptomyces sp. 2231.1]|uniref:hypothetical protein n=1 Tax=Streptomyces sp. 2231.1 TaxID=1855347 RepID=UPI00115FBE4E|nr:hypothetical protein [Streptomyces sp. 2231.1]
MGRSVFTHATNDLRSAALSNRVVPALSASFVVADQLFQHPAGIVGCLLSCNQCFGEGGVVLGVSSGAGDGARGCGRHPARWVVSPA